MRKEFSSQRIGLGHQHGRRFTVLGHQYGRRDVICKHSMIPELCAKFTIARFVDSFSISSGLLFSRRPAMFFSHSINLDDDAIFVS